MKIFCCIESFLPGIRGGGPVRALLNLVQLLEGKVEFYIFTRDHDYLDSVPYKEVIRNQWIAKDNYKIFYASDKNWRQSLRREYEQLSPDWVYLNGAFSSFCRYFLSMRKKHFASRRSSVLIAPHGCLSEVALKHHLLRKQIWLKTSHWRGLYHDVIWHAGSDREAMQIAQCFAAKNIDKRIRTVPMAPPATIHKFIKNEYNENFATTDIRKPCELKLIYFGRISKEKNLSFAVHLLNQFCEEHPEVKVSYDLIGPIEGEERFIQEIMDAVQGKKLFINYLGTKCFLEMESFLNSSEAESYHALLFPSKTENFSYTILEAMTVGIPPLISDQTPWRNLEEKGVGWDLSLNEASKWVNALSELANESPDVRRKRKQNLNAFLHQWLKNNQAMYRELFGDL